MVVNLRPVVDLGEAVVEWVLGQLLGVGVQVALQLSGHLLGVSAQNWSVCEYLTLGHEVEQLSQLIQEEVQVGHPVVADITLFRTCEQIADWAKLLVEHFFPWPVELLSVAVSAEVRIKIRACVRHFFEDGIILSLGKKLWLVLLGHGLHGCQGTASGLASRVSHERHLWKVTSQVLLRESLNIVVNAGIGEQIANGLSLSSVVEVAKQWLCSCLGGSISASTSATSCNLSLEFLNRLLILSNDGLLFLQIVLELSNFLVLCAVSRWLFNLWSTGARLL